MKILDKIRHTYYNIIPYEWRPHYLWYSLKCLLWKRYRTIHPRYLPGQTWVDRRELLAHAAFECLSQFVEQECSPGVVDWYYSEHEKIWINNRHRYVRDVIQELYVWWNQFYNKYYQQVQEELFKTVKKHSPKMEDCFFETDNPEFLEWDTDRAFRESSKLTKQDHIIHDRIYKNINILERFMEEELDEKLQMLIKIRRYMWT